jgi:hypothetical protein
MAGLSRDILGGMAWQNTSIMMAVHKGHASSRLSFPPFNDAAQAKGSCEPYENRASQGWRDHMVKCSVRGGVRATNRRPLGCNSWPSSAALVPHVPAFPWRRSKPQFAPYGIFSWSSRPSSYRLLDASSPSFSSFRVNMLPTASSPGASRRGSLLSAISMGPPATSFPNAQSLGCSTLIDCASSPLHHARFTASCLRWCCPMSTMGWCQANWSLWPAPRVSRAPPNYPSRWVGAP